MVSRRDFLKFSGLAASATFLPPMPPEEATPTVALLGRAIRGVGIFDRPSFQAKQIGLITGETVFNIYDTVISADEYYNRQWYQVQRGYVHSGLVQPVRWEEQTPTLEVPKKGFLAEVSVPFTRARNGPHPNNEAVYRFYYSTTHWVVAAETDSDQTIWYKVFDERLNQFTWVRGAHLRRIAPAEITPLSPHVRNKRIEVNLAKQTFQCFEGDVKVLDVLCATGPLMRHENNKPVYSTPSGEWQINRKRPSRHMAGDDLASADFFDLPGVPWVSYFHWWGVSIHGTYWHNDYGKPRSHGCVNLPSETAKWVYRWTLPNAGLQEELEAKGTEIIVF